MYEDILIRKGRKKRKMMQAGVLICMIYVTMLLPVIYGHMFKHFVQISKMKWRKDLAKR